MNTYLDQTRDRPVVYKSCSWDRTHHLHILAHTGSSRPDKLCRSCPCQRRSCYHSQVRHNWGFSVHTEDKYQLPVDTLDSVNIRLQEEKKQAHVISFLHIRIMFMYLDIPKTQLKNNTYTHNRPTLLAIKLVHV